MTGKQASAQPWRSLEELKASPDFDDWLKREFPREAAARNPRLSRRQFLKLMAASLAMAGATRCSPPPREQIVPYVRKPEELVPSQPLFFATARPLSGYGLGLLVESHEGRPTKAEGNPTHPASLGATDGYAQASVLELYDPERAKGPRREGAPAPWEEFWREMGRRLEGQRGRGAGLRLLTETVTSPTLAAQIEKLQARFPEATWHQYQPVNRDNARAGALIAFGQDIDSVLQVERADVILALDADFLTVGPGAVRYAHDFALRRRPEAGGMNRLYAVESALTTTGAAADHRLPLRSREVEGLARALAGMLGVEAEPSEAPAAVPRGWLEAVARDLEAQRGRSLIVAGVGQPPVVHALALRLNAALGNVGGTVRLIAPVATAPVDETRSLQALVKAMDAGEVETLIMLGGNPVYAAPTDLAFGRHLANVDLSVYLSLYADETAAAAHWHLPETHFLEAWGDARAFDGTASIIQPLIAPLYASVTGHELVARLAEGEATSAYDLVRATWQGAGGAAAAEAAWREALHAGVVADSAGADVAPSVQTGRLPPPSAPAESGLEIVFRPDPNIYDGRYFNNAWLQELPKPITSLTWDNAALMSPGTAERLGVKNEDLVRLDYRGRSLRAAVWVMPGHAPESVTLHLGYGQTKAEDEAGGGFNAYALRFADAPWIDTGLSVSATGETYPLATTQNHHLIQGRDLLRTGTAQQYAADPDFAHTRAEESEAEPPSLYPEYEYPDERWGMVIDLSACNGCNACVVACQAENNIPVVGKDEVRRGRELHWLRVDSYFSGEPEAPRVNFQPVPCMQCEKAPCEPVCPVAATVHSSDGLNDMVYNRCVGTRYCSNNCPYKVRRFNFLDYADFEEEPLPMLTNPDVTVRTRGVMEKCTYCVQRIRSAQGAAEAAGRPVGAGEVVTACQGACPAQAISFGDLNAAGSQVATWAGYPRNYAMLAELGTRPRTTYLAALRNPNPEIDEDAEA